MSVNKIDIKKIKKTGQDLVEKIAPGASVDANAAADGSILVKIRTDDAQTLIGQNGETLAAIQHLLRVMARRVFQEPCFIEVDVNDYRQKRKDYLRQMAAAAANDAALSKKEILLPPMNSYERRIVHMELAGRLDVATESRGCDPERRIAVKPS